MPMKLAASTPRALFVVFANPKPEHEAEFNRWYDEVHGPDALGNGSFTALHRFRAIGPATAPPPTSHSGRPPTTRRPRPGPISPSARRKAFRSRFRAPRVSGSP